MRGPDAAAARLRHDTFPVNPARIAARSFAFLLILIVSIAAPTQASGRGDARPPVTILISIDGFRADYLRRGHSPQLDALAASGASGPMRPSFPVKTFPNHWTLVTGMRPDRHGIVGNRMEDPARPGELFTEASEDPFWWSAVPPVWVEAERAGIRTAVLFWPGSEVAWGGRRVSAGADDVTGGTRPQDWQDYDGAVTETQRVNTVLDWLRRPAAIRPRFVAFYFDAVDTAGHNYGPGDRRTALAIGRVDRALAMLLRGLRTLRQPANLVIVADHGMAETSRDRVIALDRIANPADFRVIADGAYAGFVPRPGREAALAAALLRPHAHMQCWRREMLPVRFHYGANPRVPPFICVPETGWLIERLAPAGDIDRGSHGYDPDAPEMAALFIASGPAFRRGVRLPGFDNVDVYSLLARLLGLTPHASDGGLAPLAPALRRLGRTPV